MLTNLRIKNFKLLEDIEIELGKNVVFVGPNNSGKTTALQALALWEAGLRKLTEKGGLNSGATINRKDLTAVPVESTNLLWKDLQVFRNDYSGKQVATTNFRIEIEVSGETAGVNWRMGFGFDYANEESLYCCSLPHEGLLSCSMLTPDLAAGIRVSYLPPMSGLAATEDRLDIGAVDVRIGEGRTAEVLRNLCYRLVTGNITAWKKLTAQIATAFGVVLNEPRYVASRGQIAMSYSEKSGVELDLASSGRGLQQTLLLLAHLYTHPGACLLLDEPDAHLEILRQRQIYRLLTETASAQQSQIIAASHSEIILNEAADRDLVIAFVGKPHRIDDRGSQVLKSLKSIGFEQYYQAEQQGWVLYLEGSTDLAILQSFADLLGHPAKAALERPFVHYVGNHPRQAADHFFGLREAKPDLVGVAIFDSLQLVQSEGPLHRLEWNQNEIENYLCYPETLLEYAGQAAGEAERVRSLTAMRRAIDTVRDALRTLGKPAPFTPEIKASDAFLQPVFDMYFSELGMPNFMRKSGYYELARFMRRDQIDPEVSEKLDVIAEIAKQARPLMY